MKAGGMKQKPNGSSRGILIQRWPLFSHLALMVACCVDLEIVLLGTWRSVPTHSGSLSLEMKSYDKGKLKHVTQRKHSYDLKEQL